jgi:transposase InsO family protein
MDEQQKKAIAVFRFGVISDFVSRDLTRGEKQRLLEQKCAQSWQIPYSTRTRLARATILSWLQAYQKGRHRLEALYPSGRSDRGRSRRIDEETAACIVSLRRQLPDCCVTTLRTELKNRRLLPPNRLPNYLTLYRFLKAQNLLRPQGPPNVDRRKFEAQLPNDIWQSDAMHGPMVPAGDKRKKTYLFGFIDDMSRLVPHAGFYFSENLVSYLDALRCALLKRGLPRKLYTDNGSAFRSSLLQEICASLGIALVHSKPYTPQGRGYGKLAVM